MPWHCRVPSLCPGALSGLDRDPGEPELPPDGPRSPRDEPYWELVRAQFSFTEERVPMNAANLCPSPRSVAARVEDLTRDIDRDCSFNNRAKFRNLTEQSRAAVATQLGVSPDEIAIVRNTSEANNTINNGVPLRAGDEVVLWDQNHPTNNVAWDVRAARLRDHGTSRVSVPRHPASTQELIDPFVAALTERTRVLSLTHVSNVSGIRLPVRELVQAARPRGIHVHLDGAQSWGALDVDLGALGCDSYSASAHKWFMGPKEAGVLYVKEARIAEIWPNIVAPGWGSDADPDVKGARKFESLGQRDDACLAAVGTTAEFHAAIGAAETEARGKRTGHGPEGRPCRTGADAGDPDGPGAFGRRVHRRGPGRPRHGAAPAVRGARDRGSGDGGDEALSPRLQHARTCGAGGRGCASAAGRDSGVTTAGDGDCRV